MREIKFRFFREKPTPKMIYPECDFLINHIGTPCVITRYPKNRIEVNIADVIPLQYTGLKDKNGKEIYESDVLKWEEGKHFNACGRKCKGDYIVYVEWGESGWLPFEAKEGYSGTTMFEVRDCEVIGNIRENPELLK